MTKVIKGRVLWFDSTVGEGVVKDENGERFYVHYSAIQNRPRKNLTLKKANHKQNNLTKVLKADQEVEFTIYENSYLKQVKFIREVV